MAGLGAALQPASGSVARAELCCQALLPHTPPNPAQLRPSTLINCSHLPLRSPTCAPVQADKEERERRKAEALAAKRYPIDDTGAWGVRVCALVRARVRGCGWLRGRLGGSVRACMCMCACVRQNAPKLLTADTAGDTLPPNPCHRAAGGAAGQGRNGGRRTPCRRCASRRRRGLVGVERKPPPGRWAVRVRLPHCV